MSGEKNAPEVETGANTSSLNRKTIDENCTASIAQLATEASSAGYRIVPIGENGPHGGFKKGQNYGDLTAEEWRGAEHVGLILDRAVLVDYDGNKADKLGEPIITLDELGWMLDEHEGILPPPTQYSQGMRSVHYLYRLPEDIEVGVDIKSSADGRLAKFIDIKTGNQLMHLKEGKVLNNLMPYERLPVLPQQALDALRLGGVGVGGGGGMSFDEARENMEQGRDLHGSAASISAKMIAAGQTEEQVRELFEKLRPDIVATRGEARAKGFFNGELDSLIEGAIEKYAPNTPAFVEEEEPPLEWDNWVYVAHEVRFYHRTTSEFLSLPGFDGRFSHLTRSQQGRLRKPSTFVLETMQVQKVQFALYAPMFGEFFTYEGSPCFNTYRPHSIPKISDSFSDIYEKHLQNLFPNDWKIISQWMAWVERNPGRKVLWALLLKGTPGDGKTTIGTMMKQAVGIKNVNEVGADAVKADFNAWAEGSVLNIMEEIRISGQNRHMLMDKLKPLITNHDISVIRKGKDAFTAMNTANYMLLTNHEDAIFVDENDRRYGVFFTKYASADEWKAELDHDYWEALHDAVNNRPGEIRAWLRSIDLSDFNPKFAPEMTDAKRIMIENSKPEYVMILEEALQHDAYAVHPDVFAAGAINTVIEQHRIGKSLSPKLLANAAKTLGYVSFPQIKIRGQRYRPWIKRAQVASTSADQIRALWDSTGPFEDEMT